MTLGFQIWLSFAGAIGLLWLFRAVGLEVALRAREVLGERSHDGPPRPAPRVSIILAAKDEEQNIEVCVRSLLSQDYPDFEVIVVDDRSSDRTPALLERLARGNPDRLRVLRVDTLPAGWFGKHNAVRMGVAASTGEWLLFTDADCRQTSNRTLSLAMREAVERGAQFLSIIPSFDSQKVWERILQPVCAIVLIVRFRPGKVNNPNTPTAYANGAYMLMSRRCYNDIGGHESVRTRINEDIHLARLAKKRGWPLRVVENDGLYLVRMYDSFRGAFHGWSRIFYGCLERPLNIGMALGMVAASVVFPWVCFLTCVAAGLFAADPANSAWWWAAMAWGAVVVLVQAVTGRLYAAVGYGLGWSVTYLAGALVTVAILVNALLKSLGWTQTTWRQTTYSRAAVKRDEVPSTVTHGFGSGAPQSSPAVAKVESVRQPVT